MESIRKSREIFLNIKSFGFTKDTTSHSPISKFVFRNRALLITGIALLTLFTLYADTHSRMLSERQDFILAMIALPLLFVGLLVRLWASLYIAHGRNKKLVSSGPYSIIRNPLYLGNCLSLTGALILTGSASATLVAMTGVALLYYFIIRYEDERLEAHFGDAFIEFKKSVPRVLPRIQGFSSLVSPDKTDVICYGNVGREVIHGMMALAGVAALVLITFALRHNVF
jgi:protein-S-isoprenylcysteine O-methyltransferase Ste14